MNDTNYRVLIIDDSEDDALLILRELSRHNIDMQHQRVDTPDETLKSLKSNSWDIVLCDYSLPLFGARDVLNMIAIERIDAPCVVVTGSLGEETAADLMRFGARDYVLKGNLVRLWPAVQ